MLEGLWRDPDHAGGGGIARLLVRTMAAILRGGGLTEVCTVSRDPYIDRLLTHVGGTVIPGQLWRFTLPTSTEKF